MILSFRLASVGTILALVLSVATSSVLKCGDNITKNTVLTADLYCDCLYSDCDEYGCYEFGSDPCPLIVKGPATLDLNGHTLSCHRGTCLDTSGKGATIQNGITEGGIYAQHALLQNIIATGGQIGLSLVDNCTVLNVTAKDNDYYGIAIYGDNNRLHHVTAKNNGITGVDVFGGNNNRFNNVTAKDNHVNGIAIYGHNNQVKDSYVARTNEAGISISGTNNTVISNTVEDSRGKSSCILVDDRGDGNGFRNNTVRRCGAYGVFAGGSYSIVANNKIYATGKTSIYATGTSPDMGIWGKRITGTRITGNRITKSGANGIELAFAQKMVVDSNVIVDSAGSGIVLHSSSIRSTVLRNTVRNCGIMGLRIRGADFNNITDNTISSCRIGIHAGLGSNRNRLIHNRASNNTVVDLSDSSAKCGSNVWKGNAGNGNVACTQTM